MGNNYNKRSNLFVWGVIAGLIISLIGYLFMDNKSREKVKYLLNDYLKSRNQKLANINKQIEKVKASGRKQLSSSLKKMVKSIDKSK